MDCASPEKEPVDPFQKLLQESADRDEPEGISETTKQSDAELDMQIEELTTQLQLSSVPNPGNLRSSKRKDVRMRVRCIQALLQQRAKDA